MDNQIDPKDLKIEAYDPRPSGGMKVGLSVGVKITHLPTGTVAICQHYRNQYQNRQFALEAIELMIIGEI